MPLSVETSATNTENLKVKAWRYIDLVCTLAKLGRGVAIHPSQGEKKWTLFVPNPLIMYEL